MYLVTRRKLKKLTPMTIVCQFHYKIKCYKLLVNFVFNTQITVTLKVGYLNLGTDLFRLGFL